MGCPDYRSGSVHLLGVRRRQTAAAERAIAARRETEDHTKNFVKENNGVHECTKDVCLSVCLHVSLFLVESDDSHSWSSSNNVDAMVDVS